MSQFLIWIVVLLFNSCLVLNKPTNRYLLMLLLLENKNVSGIGTPQLGKVRNVSGSGARMIVCVTQKWCDTSSVTHSLPYLHRFLISQRHNLVRQYHCHTRLFALTPLFALPLHPECRSGLRALTPDGGH